MSTHNIPFSIYERNSHLIIQNLQPRDFFLGTQALVRNSPGKRAISVRATEDLLYMRCLVWVCVFRPDIQFKLLYSLAN